MKLKQQFQIAAIIAIMTISLVFPSCTQKTNPPPYTIQLVEYENSNLPELHSHTHAIMNDKIIMLGGRTNGLHDGSYNLSLINTNKFVYVIDTHNWNDTVSKWTVYKTADTAVAGTYTEAFRTNNAQFYTENNVLYVIGGLRGAKTVTKLSDPNNTSSKIILDSSSFTSTSKDTTLPARTLSTITAINLKDLVNTVMNGTAMPTNAIRQTQNDALAITGGELKIMNNKVHLVFGWSFGTPASYNYDPYSHQIRTFKVNDDGQKLSLSKVEVCESCWDGINQYDTSATKNNEGYFRRRDGSMSAAIDPADGSDALIYYAGVFKGSYTNFDNPVWISNASAKEIDFTMRSNVYTCQVIPVYSKSKKEFYASMLGGMKNATYTGNSITKPTALGNDNAPIYNVPVQKPDSVSGPNANTVPYTNQFTTIVVDAKKQFKQYLLPDSFPAPNHTITYKKVDTSVTITAKTPCYNGSESIFVPTAKNAKNLLPNGVIDYDAFIAANPSGGTVGYLHGGIISLKDNAFQSNIQSKVTFASGRIFAVKIIPYK